MSECSTPTAEELYAEARHEGDYEDHLALMHACRRLATALAAQAAAEAEVERLRESDTKWIDWDIKCNVEMLDLRQRAEAAEASWQQAEAVIADQTAKLATAQQREAALREAARSALDSLHWPNYKAVCERLLGLDDAARDESYDEWAERERRKM